MFRLAAFIFAFAAVVNILSIPKIPAEMRQFVEWLGMSATEWHWWNYAGFFGGLFFMALAAYGMYVHWDGHPSFLRRKRPKGIAYSADAMPASFHLMTSEATVNVRPPPWSKPILRIRSVWGRRRGSRPANKRLQNVPDLKRCLDELIKYSGFPVTEKVTANEIEASNALLVHLSRACAILDDQGESHPKIEKGLTVTNHTEWIEFLTKRLAQADAR